MRSESGKNQFSPAKAIFFPTHDEEKPIAYMRGFHFPVVVQEFPDVKSSRSDERSSAFSSENELMHQLTYMLLDCGIPANLTGYLYVRKAILLDYHNADYRGAVYKALYPDVAAYFHTTPSRVERAIRHAIEVGWSRGNIEVLEKYFGYSTNPNRGKPTNSAFIATISDHLQLRCSASPAIKDNGTEKTQFHM
ncbi:MAG TPA: hypothetical protein DGZ34_00200 [Lachnospiraceae bacterium]|nr:hypothetical protein [Lachnospiraceae bacterium]